MPSHVAVVMLHKVTSSICDVAGKMPLNLQKSTIIKIAFLRCTLLKIIKNEPAHEISNNVVCATSKASDQPAHMRSLIRAFASRLNIL